MVNGILKTITAMPHRYIAARLSKVMIA